MRISYSSLENFHSCPQKYKFSAIDKIKEPKSKELIFGNYIHDVLYWLYKENPYFPSLEVLLDYYQKNWPDKSVFNWLDEKEEKKYFQQGELILRNFYEANKNYQSLILDLEAHFEAVIDENPETSDGKHILSGIIDRIDKLPDGTFEIIDYKTGKRPPPNEMILDSNFQLSIYAIGLKERWPKVNLDDLRLSLYYLKPGEKLESRRTEEDLEQAKSRIINLIHQIQTSDFKPRVSNFCDWCGYKKICPAWRHLYESNNIKDNINGLINEYLSLKEQQEENIKRLNELNEKISRYCEDNNLEQVFGTNGSLLRVDQEKVAYNLEKLKTILEPLGKWEKILCVDAKRLEQVLREIPLDARKKVEEAKVVKKSVRVLNAISKHIPGQGIKPPLS